MPLELCVGRTQGSLLQKQVIFTKESNQEAPHLERCKKNHPVKTSRFGLVLCDWGDFFTSKLLDYLTSHLDYWIMDHLIGQIFIQFL